MSRCASLDMLASDLGMPDTDNFYDSITTIISNRGVSVEQRGPLILSGNGSASDPLTISFSEDVPLLTGDDRVTISGPNEVGTYHISISDVSVKNEDKSIELVGDGSASNPLSVRLNPDVPLLDGDGSILIAGPDANGTYDLSLSVTTEVDASRSLLLVGDGTLDRPLGVALNEDVPLVRGGDGINVTTDQNGTYTVSSTTNYVGSDSVSITDGVLALTKNAIQSYSGPGYIPVELDYQPDSTYRVGILASSIQTSPPIDRTVVWSKNGSTLGGTPQASTWDEVVALATPMASSPDDPITILILPGSYEHIVIPTFLNGAKLRAFSKNLVTISGVENNAVSITMSDCVIMGTNGSFGEKTNGGDGSVAITNTSSLTCENCTIIAGDGGSGDASGIEPLNISGGNGAAGIVNQSLLTVTRCSIKGGNGGSIASLGTNSGTGGYGGVGIDNQDGAIVCNDCTIQGGDGGNVSSLDTGISGDGGRGISNAQALVLSLTCTSCTIQGGAGGQIINVPNSHQGTGGKGIYNYRNSISCTDCVITGGITPMGVNGTGVYNEELLLSSDSFLKVYNHCTLSSSFDYVVTSTLYEYCTNTRGDYTYGGGMPPSLRYSS